MVCSALDLNHRLGCTPAWWQLLKGLYEIGNELIVIPYLGDPIESLWWETRSNPCSLDSKLYEAFVSIKCGRKASKNGLISKCFNTVIQNRIKPRWRSHLKRILENEKDIDSLLFMNIPINHIAGIPFELSREYGVKTAFLEGDMPTILPQYADGRGFKFSYYVDTDLSEFDFFFTNSKGVIPDLIEMRANNVHTIYYAADPELFRPMHTKKEIDISFFGYGNEFRDDWMTKMITIPSNEDKFNILIGGSNFNINLGKAKIIGDFPYSAFRKFCCKSKICLNITRWSHASIYASATARPFELAAYASCIVSQPYYGIGEWFEPGKELMIVNDEKEALEVYKWLLDDESERTKLGENARNRILKEHTYYHRAKDIVNCMRN